MWWGEKLGKEEFSIRKQQNGERRKRSQKYELEDILKKKKKLPKKRPNHVTKA